MKKTTQLWVILFAFLFGQLIQLVTNAMAQYLYVSDPVIMCLTVGIVTVALAVTTSIFTLMDTEKQPMTYAQHVQRNSDGFNKVIPKVFAPGAKRPPLDTDPVDITAEDEAVRKEENKTA